MLHLKPLWFLRVPQSVCRGLLGAERCHVLAEKRVRTQRGVTSLNSLFAVGTAGINYTVQGNLFYTHQQV